MLESCERVKSNVLRIHFDTIKKDKKERNYELEKSLCQVMLLTFSDIPNCLLNFCYFRN